jgi:hypothetical protein
MTMGFFLRPKDQNLDRTNNHINAEAIGVVSDYEDEYTNDAGVAVHKRRHPSQATEPKQSAPLPSGNWRGPVSRTSASGFGRGTRAGKTR